MTVSRLMDYLKTMPEDAVVLMEGDVGLSRVSGVDFIEAQGPGAPAQVILSPSMEERNRDPNQGSKRFDGALALRVHWSHVEGMTMTTLFHRAGGQAAIDRLVDSFYDRMDRLPEAREIRAMHGRDLEPVKAVLKLYFAEWMGGPKRYSAERGHPRLRQRHLGFPIDEAQRDSWLLCMRAALDDAITDPEARADIHRALDGLADWMRNAPGNPHDARRPAH